MIEARMTIGRFAGWTGYLRGYDIYHSQDLKTATRGEKVFIPTLPQACADKFVFGDSYELIKKLQDEQKEGKWQGWRFQVIGIQS